MRKPPMNAPEKLFRAWRWTKRSSNCAASAMLPIIESFSGSPGWAFPTCALPTDPRAQVPEVLSRRGLPRRCPRRSRWPAPGTVTLPWNMAQLPAANLATWEIPAAATYCKDQLLGALGNKPNESLQRCRLPTAGLLNHSNLRVADHFGL